VYADHVGHVCCLRVPPLHHDSSSEHMCGHGMLTIRSSMLHTGTSLCLLQVCWKLLVVWQAAQNMHCCG
jgi:hypothetical protein